MPSPALPHRLSQSVDAQTTPRDRAVAHLRLGIAVVLYTWPALSLAVQNAWGGPQSAAKRDWLCATIPDVLLGSGGSDVDEGYVEELLIQVMDDEFEVDIDDDSMEEVAAAIVKVWKGCFRGDLGETRRLYENWVAKSGNNVTAVRGNGDGDGDGDDDDDDDDDDEDDNVNAEPRPPREKIEPEIDEDGFTTVVKGKKK